MTAEEIRKALDKLHEAQSKDIVELMQGAWRRIFWDEETQSVKSELIPCEKYLERTK